MAFLHGMVAMGFVVAGVFFLRFWRRTRERLFVMLALSFWLLAFGQILLGVSDAYPNQGWEFLPNLGAFSLLILGILMKNFGETEKGR